MLSWSRLGSEAAASIMSMLCSPCFLSPLSMRYPKNSATISTATMETDAKAITMVSSRYSGRGSGDDDITGSEDDITQQGSEVRGQSWLGAGTEILSISGS